MSNLAHRASLLGTETAFTVLARAAELSAMGKDIINLGIGQPDFPTPEHIVEAGIKALRDGHHGYTPSGGVLKLREAVAALLHAQTGAEISPSRIQILPGGKVVIFFAAMIGACLGFLWYNGFPAQVFMGDTGSMALGGAVAAVAIIIKMELLLPILCGIFFAESLSVILQVSYFKYTKKKYGEGKRIFLMSPLHHHYQKKGIPESKITLRFWLITVILILATIALIKLR